MKTIRVETDAWRREDIRLLVLSRPSMTAPELILRSEALRQHNADLCARALLLQRGLRAGVRRQASSHVCEVDGVGA